MGAAAKLFATNANSEADGVWQDFGGFRVRIARAGGANKRFAMLLTAKTKPYQRAVTTNTLDPDLGQRLLQEVYAECVVTGWQTEIEGEWKDVVEVALDVYEPYSPAAVLKAFNFLPNMFKDILDVATGFASFRDEVRLANSGN